MSDTEDDYEPAGVPAEDGAEEPAARSVVGGDAVEVTAQAGEGDEEDTEDEEWLRRVTRETEGQVTRGGSGE
jgi:hypothetical protein